MAKEWIAIDWDNTLFDTPNNRPMEGARDALSDLHERGHRVLIHSANRKEWIVKCCDEWDIRYDGIWDQPGKPAYVACFIDDRAIQFRGNWSDSVKEVLRFVADRPSS